MTRRRGMAGIAGPAVAVLLAGCVGLGGGGVPETHYYALLPPGAAAGAGAAAADIRLGVEAFDVDPPYDQDRLVYRPSSDSTEVGFYNYHRWAAPLGRLTAAALAAGLAEGPGVDAEPWSAAGRYAAVLDGRVIRLEEVDSPGGQEVRLALELRLRRPGGDPFWTTTLETSAAGQAASGGEIMGLVRQAFERLVDEARPAVEAALAGAV